VDNSDPFQNTAVVAVYPLPSAIAIRPELPAGTGSLKAVNVIFGWEGGFGDEEVGDTAPHPTVDSVAHKINIWKRPIATNCIKKFERFTDEQIEVIGTRACADNGLRSLPEH
jgi:hypothetical protein